MWLSQVSDILLLLGNARDAYTHYLNVIKVWGNKRLVSILFH